jgi:hypothetical protein
MKQIDFKQALSKPKVYLVCITDIYILNYPKVVFNVNSLKVMVPAKSLKPFCSPLPEYPKACRSKVKIPHRRICRELHLWLLNIFISHYKTLCDYAQKACPTFPAKTSLIHVGFEDPSRFAENARDKEEAMRHYRQAVMR